MILALDYGTKRVGVAISDPTGTLASTLPYLPADSLKKLLESIRKLVQEKNIKEVIIGLPRNMDGSYGPAAQKVQEFIAKLKTVLSIPIQTVDERLSTVQASRQLHEAGLDTRKQKEKVDSAAARVLLQHVLDSRGGTF